MQNQYIFPRTICKHGNTFALARKTTFEMWLFQSESKSVAWNLNSASSSVASKYIKLISPAESFTLWHTNFPALKHVPLSWAHCWATQGRRSELCTSAKRHSHSRAYTFLANWCSRKKNPKNLKIHQKKKQNKNKNQKNTNLKKTQNQQNNPQAKNSSWKRQRWEPWVTLPLSVCLHRWQMLPPPSPTLTRGREVASISVIKWIMTPYAVLQPSNK